MGAYIVRRLWQMVPTMLGVVLLVFFLFNWVGGDPAYVLAGKISNQEQIDNIRRQLGVDQPYWVQLGIFLKQIVTADFGASWSTNERVSHIMMTRLGPSLTVLVPLQERIFPERPEQDERDNEHDARAPVEEPGRDRQVLDGADAVGDDAHGVTLTTASKASGWWSSTSNRPGIVAVNGRRTGFPGVIARSTL